MTSLLLAQASSLDPVQLSGYVTALVFGLWVAIEKIKSSKIEKKTKAESDVVSEAKAFQARNEILTKLADDNLQLYIKEHESHEKTREYWHTKATEFQSTLSSCQEKLAEMQARPDLSTVIEFIRQQSQTSLEILGGIKEILTAMKNGVAQKL